MVSGRWSGGYSGSASAITDLTGQCTLTSGAMLEKKAASVTFSVTDVSSDSYPYEPSANHVAEITMPKP